jgi:hypothetical protein
MKKQDGLVMDTETKKKEQIYGRQSERKLDRNIK